MPPFDYIIFLIFSKFMFYKNNVKQNVIQIKEGIAPGKESLMKSHSIFYVAYH